VTAPARVGLAPWWGALIVVGVSLALSLLAIGRESLWFDESVTVRVGRLSNEAFRNILETREPFWALYYSIMRPWMELGDSTVWLRLPSAIAAAVAVALTYLTARRMFDERVAFFGALVLAMHGFLLQYAVEARGYALAAALIAASTLAFVLACERPGWLRWAAYAVLTVAAIYAHFFAAMVVGAHALSVLVLGRRWLESNAVYAVAAWLATAAASWPLAQWLLDAEQTRRFVRPVTPDRVLAAFTWFGGGNVVQRYDVLYYVLAIGSMAIVALACVHLVSMARADRNYWRAVLLGGWILAPLLLSIAISLTIKPVFAYRYLIVSLPGLAIGAGLVVARVRLRPLRVVAIGAIVVVLLAGAWPVLAVPIKPDWNGAARIMAEEATADDVVIMQPWWQRTPLFYAIDQLGASGRAPELSPTNVDSLPSLLAEYDRDGRRIWLVLFDYNTEPNLDNYEHLELLEAGRVATRHELFHRVRVILYELDE
jgi:mannosyltransferase